VRFSLAPCGSHVAFFENLAGLSADAGGRGGVGLLQAALLFADHGLELAALPRPAWRALEAAGVPLARALGYRSEYPEYASGMPGAGGSGGGGDGGGGSGGGGGGEEES
jgi:hypothetical protein